LGLSVSSFSNGRLSLWAVSLAQCRATASTAARYTGLLNALPVKLEKLLLISSTADAWGFAFGLNRLNMLIGLCPFQKFFAVERKSYPLHRCAARLLFRHGGGE